MAVARTGNRQYGVRKPKTSRRSSGSGASRNVRRKDRPEALPGWSDLAGSNHRSPTRGRGSAFLEKVPTTRFALLITALAVAFTAYVGHVHATQDLLAHLQQLRRENLQLHLKYNRLKGDFDRMVGPSVIYERARRLGLVEDARQGPTIEIER